MFWQSVIKGLVSTLIIPSSELYRYPYRNAGEAFRGDWKRIGGDITRSLQYLEEYDTE